MLRTGPFGVQVHLNDLLKDTIQSLEHFDQFLMKPSNQIDPLQLWKEISNTKSHKNDLRFLHYTLKPAPLPSMPHQTLLQKPLCRFCYK